MNEQQLFQVLTEVHQRLNDAGVPSAQGAICDDPACRSNLGHRVKVLIEERDQLKEERARLSAAFLTMRAAQDEAAKLGEYADVGKVNEARRELNRLLEGL